MDKKSWKYLPFSVLFFLISLFPAVKQLVLTNHYLLDFAAYCAISRALFEGNNPFPDHHEFLFCKTHGGGVVPIVYPGQMLLFVIPAYLWNDILQIVYFALNIGGVFFLFGLTFVKVFGYQWRDLWLPGRKQFIYVLSCALCLLSCCVKDSLRWGQPPIIMAVCFYCIFWGPVSSWLRTFCFALIALLKYSVLPVVAPLLFFKGHWKLCISAFFVFLFFSITPVFCGNNLVEVFTEYSKAVHQMLQPGFINHYGTHSEAMCHLGFFRIGILNLVLKAMAICVVLWLFWRERKTAYLSDTLLLSAFCLTMLISYHRCYDLVLVYPLLLIRLYHFVRTKQWWFFGITLMFPLFLCIPRPLLYDRAPALIGGIPGLGSIVILCEYTPNRPLFPILPFFMIALTLWSLFLYLHEKEPYRFYIPGSRSRENKSEA